MWHELPQVKTDFIMSIKCLKFPFMTKNVKRKKTFTGYAPLVWVFDSPFSIFVVLVDRFLNDKNE